MGIKKGPVKRIQMILNSEQVVVLAENNVNSSEVSAVENQILKENEDNQIEICQPSKSSSKPNPIDPKTSLADTFCINVRQCVQEYDRSHTKGTKTLESTLDSGIVSSVQRQALVRIVVTELVTTVGHAYPSSEQKVAAAASIIADFPLLKSGTKDHKNYEHYYDPLTNTGFIQYRLKTYRKNLPNEQKKRSQSKLKKKTVNIKKEDPLLLDDDTFYAKVADLQIMLPNDTNKYLILKLMDETRINRQLQIKDVENFLSVNEILNLYPRFKDYNGELIFREFQGIFSKCDYFLGKFSSFYAPRILKFCKITKPNLLNCLTDFDDDNIKALILLPEILPVPNYSKKKTNNPALIKGIKRKLNSNLEFAPKEIPNSNLVRFLPRNDSLLFESSVDEKSNIQPFLICAVSGNKKDGEYYIRADSHLVPIGNNFIRAFDGLVKFFYCFDIEFPPDLENFYNFLSSCVLAIEDIKPKSCCAALNSSLININLNNELEISITNCEEDSDF